jgi:hypothetical protein
MCVCHARLSCACTWPRRRPDLAASLLAYACHARVACVRYACVTCACRMRAWLAALGSLLAKIKPPMGFAMLFRHFAKLVPFRGTKTVFSTCPKNRPRFRNRLASDCFFAPPPKKVPLRGKQPKSCFFRKTPLTEAYRRCRLELSRGAAQTADKHGRATDTSTHRTARPTAHHKRSYKPISSV